jgi:hypothetical protein
MIRAKIDTDHPCKDFNEWAQHMYRERMRAWHLKLYGNKPGNEDLIDIERD